MQHTPRIILARTPGAWTARFPDDAEIVEIPIYSATATLCPACETREWTR